MNLLRTASENATRLNYDYLTTTMPSHFNNPFTNTLHNLLQRANKKVIRMPCPSVFLSMHFTLTLYLLVCSPPAWTCMLIVHGVSLNSDFSARSRVRGYLELYHAFLHDVVIPNANLIGAENANEDREWEIINSEPRVEAPAQVKSQVSFTS